MQADQFLVVSGLIRSHIDNLDNYSRALSSDTEDEADTDTLTETASNHNEYNDIRQLGSTMKPCSFAALEETHQNDPAFRRFRLRLGEYLTAVLPLFGIPLLQGKAIKFHSTDAVRANLTDAV